MIAGANQNPNINFETFVNLVANNKSFHDTSCAKVVLQTIQETVLAKVGKDSEYSGVIERMLVWI